MISMFKARNLKRRQFQETLTTKYFYALAQKPKGSGSRITWEENPQQKHLVSVSISQPLLSNATSGAPRAIAWIQKWRCDRN